VTDKYLRQVDMGNTARKGLHRILWLLSLAVVLGVFWCLKLTGITMAGDAFCGQQEHVHTESCMQKNLICELAETAGHVHGEDCLSRVLVCTLEEQPEHVHEEACYAETTECICPLEESEGHAHGENCYMETTECICPLEESEEHTHDETCYASETVCICTLEETEGHTHEESCYEVTQQCICGQEETAGHAHEDACYAAEAESVSCGLEEIEGHQHGEECYEIVLNCDIAEHVHEVSCYSDIKADVETNDDWEKLLGDIVLTDDVAENVLSIARSQLGYQESTRNYEVDDDGLRRGITRYGQWYGNPYGDWSAMFAGFCLHYGKMEDFPMNAGAESMRLEWEEADLYRVKEQFAPASGELLFLDKDENGTADAVAVIDRIEDNTLFVIEGDLENTVAEASYSMEGQVVLGYGRVPHEPQLQFALGEGARLIAQTGEDSQQLLTDGNHIVVYVADVEGFYALDGHGELVPVAIDENGQIFTEAQVPELLIWNVITSEESGEYEIRNLVTDMYLPEGGIRPMAMYAARDVSQTGDGGAYQYARAVDYSVWLDGTCGSLMSYGDSPNQRYTVAGGTTFKLPDTWQSPSEYSYTLRGWYDVVNNVYYNPGDEVTVNENLVFYADWVASSYNIGQFNSQVANTVSTNEFVTTRMFDYNVLFNVLSSSAKTEISSSSHTETWSLITNGTSPYSGETTLNYIFRDWDRGSRDITYPSGVSSSSPHYPTDAGSVYPGLYNNRIGSLLFDPGTKVIGKEYLGTADHLFQLNTDPNDEHYGYYYYDSELNAASYNRSAQRFYVYDYLEQTTVSSTTTGTGKYSDFLPFNSPYANTNGQAPALYSYAGKNGEYSGVSHYMYDATDESASNVASNFFFGMSVDIGFYLPNAPGSGGNKDVYGKDMHFQFSGDDDVWVFVDGKMVLDLGGIHGMESGDINFSTGVVTVNGTRNDALSNTLQSIGAGEHTLSLYYLERGSSMSNCAIYFNLAPRFSFSIQKEDILTKDVLNGAEFSVFTDQACTQPAELWPSKAAHDRGEASTNRFTVIDGVANMWGMGAGNTYYIKETKPPDDEEYTYARGIICITIDKQGVSSYSVEMLEDDNGSITGGFTVHGFRVDEQTQRAYIVATNAPKWVQETTGLWVHKKWNDDKDHSGEIIDVYLTVTDADGTVRRLQKAQLGSENNWKYRWENLPKYAEDGVTPISYGVEEAYVSGYFSKSEETDSFTTITTQWSETTTLTHGKTYIFKTSSGYLSTLNGNSDTGFKWVSEDEAKTSPLALWTVNTSGNQVKLTNGAGQVLCFYYGNGSPTDFFAATGLSETNNVKQYYRYNVSSGGIRLYYDASRDYYLTSNMNSSQKFGYSTSSGSGMVLTPITQTVTTSTENVEGLAYEITNTPLEEETSLTVTKAWDYGFVSPTSEHEQAQVTVKLLANGRDTGRTVTLNLKNHWTDTFRGLPYTDDTGELIRYSVQENWATPDWIPQYGEILVIDGAPPTYSTTITNHYRWGQGAILPSTGSAARMLFVLCGGGIMLASLVYGIVIRSKRGRRRNKHS